MGCGVSTPARARAAGAFNCICTAPLLRVLWCMRLHAAERACDYAYVYVASCRLPPGNMNILDGGQNAAASHAPAWAYSHTSHTRAGVITLQRRVEHSA